MGMRIYAMLVELLIIVQLIQKIIRSKIYQNIFIQPAAGDSGGALGCALGSSYLLKEKNFNYQNTSVEKVIIMKK